MPPGRQGTNESPGANSVTASEIYLYSLWQTVNVFRMAKSLIYRAGIFGVGCN
jgi:hypothetical protein